MINMVYRTLRALAIGAAVACASVAPAALAKAPATISASQPYQWHDVKGPEGQTYRIFVSVPKVPAPPAGFPVIYVVDGNAWAPLVSALVAVDSSEGAGNFVAPAIVVGIGYPTDDVFDLKRRVWDLTTPSDKHLAVIPDRTGGYAGFINFIQNQVKPEIERAYPIDRTRQTLMGHSLGGLFTLRTLLAHPDWFQNYAALSPSVWWDDAALLKDVKTIAPDATTAARTHVYIGVGEFEQHMSIAYRQEMLTKERDYVAHHPEMLQGRRADEAMAALIAHGTITKMVDNARDMQFALADKGYVTRFDAFPEEDHFSAAASEMTRALAFVSGQ